MKKLKYILLIVVVTCFTACHTHSSSDGDLDNYWYLTQVDTIATGGTTVDFRKQRVFWAFQGTMMQVQKISEEQKYVCHFQKDDDILYQNQLYRSDRMHGDVLMDQDSIRQYNINECGINQPIDTFMVETLTGNTMVLNNGNFRLHFEGY